MSRKLLMALSPALITLLAHAVAAAEQLPPACQWISKDAVLMVEARPKALLDLAVGPKMTAAVTSLPGYQKQVAQPQFQQFLGLVKFLEGMLGSDWRGGTHKLLDGGVTLAVYPKGAALAIVDAEDEKMLNQLHQMLVSFAKTQEKSEKYHDVTLSTLGKDEAHAIIGRRLLLANRAEVLKAALDRRQASDGSLASLPAYQAARQAASPDAVAWAYVNLSAVKRDQTAQKLLKQNTEPVVALLFAGLADAVQKSNWLALSLRLDGPTLSLKAVADGSPSAGGLTAFAGPTKPEEGALPNFSVPGQIAGLTFYRDLHAFYANKDKLFPERTGGLIFFENMMGIFFSGRDLTEEVLGQAKPEVRFVVAAPRYAAAAGVPQVQIPAFAAIFHVRNPEKFAEVVEEAWQKAVGLINITRGQKAQGGMIIDRPTHKGVCFTMARFAAGREEDKEAATLRHNYQPSLARVGEYLVLSSTDGLTKDLIDALQNQSGATPLAGTSTLVELDGNRGAAVIQANRATLVRQNMLEKGSSQEEAEANIDLVRALVERLGKARLEVATRGGHTEAALEVKLNHTEATLEVKLNLP